MILDIGTEELSHVEMRATMVARLLQTSLVEVQEDVAQGNSLVGSILGGGDTSETILAGMNPQRMIVNGMGPHQRTAWTTHGPQTLSSPAAT